MTHAHRKIPQLVDGKIPKWGKLRDRQMRKVMSRTSASSVVKRLTYITHASRLSPQPFCQFLIATRRSGAAAAAGGLASATDPEWWYGINVIRALSFACLLEILLQCIILSRITTTTTASWWLLHFLQLNYVPLSLPVRLCSSPLYLLLLNDSWQQLLSLVSLPPAAPLLSFSWSGLAPLLTAEIIMIACLMIFISVLYSALFLTDNYKGI